jgi:NDP-sugar pyrophosphorylase family protein
MYHTHDKENISTALLLAAGMGSRLRPLTNNIPKCLARVNESPILDHLVQCLHQHNFKRLVVVVGYLEQSIRDLLDKIAGSLKVEYIVSPQYETTNNIYSLWLAREIIQEPFVLIESDLVFTPPLLEEMLLPDRIAISHILPWMTGSTVTISARSPHHVTDLHINPNQDTNGTTYKTVNIYSLSRQSWNRITRRLDFYISAGRVNAYYESVFAEMIADGSLGLECVFFDKALWYEIDTLHDLREGARIFQ